MPKLVIPALAEAKWTLQINTVQLSNHTAYKTFPGDRYDGSLIEKLAGGLEQNGLLRYSQILTGEKRKEGRIRSFSYSGHFARPLLAIGYLGSASMLPAIAEVVKKVKNVNPDALFGGFVIVKISLKALKLIQSCSSQSWTQSWATTAAYMFRKRLWIHISKI